ncbi:hypothetical protein HLBENOHH_02082 [Aeromonas dhakensis]|uniref:hypothetical protein n=1 Tax=Aeromonas dhakensis TaxID=196024 RepID=UPI0036722DC0
MIDFTDYTTYLYGFIMLVYLYFGYDGSYSRQTQYKPEHRCTKSIAIGLCVFNIIFFGTLYYFSYTARNELIQEGYKAISLTELNVWLGFGFVYLTATAIGAYRGAKKLNEEEAR